MRRLGKIIVIILASIGGVAVAVVALISLLVSMIDLEEKAAEQLPDQAILYINLDEPFPEDAPPSPLFGLTHTPISLQSAITAIEAAATDTRIKAVLARTGGGKHGMAETQELRNALLKLRDAGKRSLVFAPSLEGNATMAYYLASAFDEVWIQPSGGLGLTGFASEVPFAHDALATLGISFSGASRHEFKNAMDPLLRQDMSQPHRESLGRLLDSWTAQVTDGIATARDLKPDAVAAVLAGPPLFAGEARDAGLIDTLDYWGAALDSIKESAGTDKIVTLEKYAAATHKKPNDDLPKIAYIPAIGAVQGGNSSFDAVADRAKMGAETVTKAFRDAMDDEQVKAIVLRVSSPGGSYIASDTIWAEVLNARTAGLPVIVSMGDMAASGGYFIAMPATRIVAQPGTITGSVGVFGFKPVLQDLWGKLDINWESVAANNYSLMWSSNRPFSAEQQALFERAMDTIYGDFTDKLAEGRGLTPEQVDAVARGRIWTGSDAKDHGLVDELGGFNDAVRIAKTESGMQADAKVTVVRFPRPKTSFEQLQDMLEGNDFPMAMARMTTLLEASAPLARELDRARLEAQGPAVLAPRLGLPGTE